MNMKIKLNGNEQEVQTQITLFDFVCAELKTSEPKGIASAINGKIVSKSKWNETLLEENDEIEIVHAVQGG
jgi:sulfur carrier protein